MQVQDYTKNSARDLDSLINVLDPYFFSQICCRNERSRFFYTNVSLLKYNLLIRLFGCWPFQICIIFLQNNIYMNSKVLRNTLWGNSPLITFVKMLKWEMFQGR